MENDKVPLAVQQAIYSEAIMKRVMKIMKEVKKDNKDISMTWIHDTVIIEIKTKKNGKNKG